MNLDKRRKEKAKARKKDQEDLAKGISPEVIQKRNSILPKSFFKNAKIENFDEAFGK